MTTGAGREPDGEERHVGAERFVGEERFVREDRWGSGERRTDDGQPADHDQQPHHYPPPGKDRAAARDRLLRAGREPAGEERFVSEDPRAYRERRTDDGQPADHDQQPYHYPPPGKDRAAARDRLLRAGRERLDRLGGPDGTAVLRTEEALAEADALLRHLVLAEADGGPGVDPEVAYALGVTLMVRGGEADTRMGLLLLAPFHCHLPGTPDPLPPPLRAGLDALLGTGRPEDPEAVVREHAASLVNVGYLLLELGLGLTWPEALEACAVLTRGALPHLAAGGPDRAVAGCNLGYALLVLSDAPGRDTPGDPAPDRLDEAVRVFRTALAATAPDHGSHARCANGLALALLATAARTQDRTRLPEVIELLRTATRGAGPADGNAAQMHSDLGYVLTLHAADAERDEDMSPEVRAEAVTALHRALDLTPAEDEAAVRSHLDRLAQAALIGLPRADRDRAAELAADAADVLRRLLDLTPADHPEREDVRLRLAANLMAAGRPEEGFGLLAAADPVFTGDSRLIGETAARLRAQSLGPDEPPTRTGLSPELQADADAIDAIVHAALSGEDDSHPIAAVLSLLGMGPQGGGSGRGQEVMDFGKLILGHPGQSSLGDIFGQALELELQRLARMPEAERAQAVTDLLRGTTAEPGPREPVDTGALDEILGVYDRLLAAAAPDSREHRLLRTGRSTLLVGAAMHAEGDAAARLERMRGTLPLLRELYEELPLMMADMGLSPELFAGHAALAFAHDSPFDHVQALEDGVRGARRRLARLTPGTREYDDTRTTLAMHLFTRHGLWSEETDYTEAETLARELTATGAPDLRTALLVQQWASAAQHRVQRGRLLEARPAGEGRSPSLITRLACDSAAQALDRHDPVEALETLEDGRAHLLSTALNARRELSVLRGTDAGLHARLRSALDRLRALRRSAEPGRWPGPDQVAEQRAATEHAARLITELQQRPDFQRFLTPLPLGLDDLRPAAAEGPVVSVNVHPRRCDALVLRPDGVLPVPLPGLDAAGLAAQAESFRLAVGALTAGPRDPLFETAREIFTGTLAWLWDVLAEPVLDALGFTGPPAPGAPWPRLWWSPSGVLNSFPLHAAGHHGPGAPAGAAVLDRVASSYTPTLRALLYSRARRRAAPGRRGVLAVAMPQTPGQAPLARTVAEAGVAVAASGGDRLVGPDATRAAVCGALPGAAVVHFACHADSDPEDAAAGRLLLADGDLCVGEIAELHLESAELAYLSACGTARGSASPAFVDEVIHLASVFQVAGYTQSVATLWEVGDAFAAEAAAAFHHTLAPALPDPSPLPAALALHDTVRALRSADPDRPWTWAALVHAGA
ncbi:CHAT domain-containing protein [Streptomyces sp. NPDC005890]|uniref:CHAT domain-containing protein n=1 Tax=Streptomyces sp. NPDC005890 TaxID=3154568 RepID=UPI00340102B2